MTFDPKNLQELSHKWTPVRIYGPRVTEEQALEFIRRTDSTFSYCSTNDRQFRADFAEWIGISENDYQWKARFLDEFGHLRLEHFAPSWIASCYIDGPGGLVSPTGRVELALNFGKWPSLEEIHNELDVLAREFPWLEFTMGLWDTDEDDTGYPTHRYHLVDGKWEAQDPLIKDYWPSTPEFSATNFLTHRETTWTIEQLDKMWGEQVRNAVKESKNDLRP